MRFLTIILFASLVCSSTFAQDMRISERLALAVAKVCANEASLEQARPADCALIWQTTRRHGRTPGARLAWLRAHSSCVLSERPLSARELLGNCVWSRHLSASEEAPQAWPEQIAWPRYAPRWRTMRAFARRLVAGAVPPGGWPCTEDPFTWGGPMDHADAVASGLVPLSCRGTLNEGYRYQRVAEQNTAFMIHVGQPWQLPVNSEIYIGDSWSLLMGARRTRRWSHAFPILWGSSKSVSQNTPPFCDHPTSESSARSCWLMSSSARVSYCKNLPYAAGGTVDLPEWGYRG